MPDDSAATVLLVGHCGPDSWMLKAMVQRTLRNAQIKNAHSLEQIEREMDDRPVLLINRVLDGDFGVSNGVDLIRELSSYQAHPPTMLLISNFEDAQRDAHSAGALPGFGKADTNSVDAAERLKAAADRARHQSQ